MKKIYLVLARVFFYFLFLNNSLSATAYVWGSYNDLSGDPVEWNGVDKGYLISDQTEVSAMAHGVVTLTAADSLTIREYVQIEGDIELRFTGSSSSSVSETVVVNLGTGADDSNPENHVTIQAYNDIESNLASAAHLVFNPSLGKTIEVRVLNSAFFIGADRVGGGSAVPLHISIRGRGTTRFRLPGGRLLSFGANAEGRGAGSWSTVGTKIQVLMDQTYDDAVTNRINQLVFERWSYDGTPVDGLTNDIAQDALISIGQLSSLSYVSNNERGCDESYMDSNNNHVIDAADTPTFPGYGSIAFDPSNSGSGRLLLELAPGQSLAGNDFKDAAFNIYGNCVVPDDLSDENPNAHVGEDGYRVANSDLRDNVYHNRRAGIQAIMRIIDQVAFNAIVPFESDPEYVAQYELWKKRDEAERRGLGVICRNGTIPLWSTNFEGALSIDKSMWGFKNAPQSGFVIGNNGWLDIGHNLFLDYIAVNTNTELTSQHRKAYSRYTFDSDKVKKHNPAALCIDGIGQYENYSSRGTDAFGRQIYDMTYANPLMRAHITLRGSGSLFVRAAHTHHGQALYERDLGQWYDADLANGMYLPGQGVYLGRGHYDGTVVSVIDSVGNPTQLQSESPDGEYALDVEGPLLIESVEGLDGQKPAGVLTMPSVRIDYAGRETCLRSVPVTTAQGTSITFVSEFLVRPLNLLTTSYYSVYNISSILVNDTITLSNVTLKHSDVTRVSSVDTLNESSAASSAALVGGERASLHGEAFPPIIYLENSTIELHESLVVSGVTFAVANLPRAQGDARTKADNSSKLVCYNRGRVLDTGLGRVFQLGSQSNLCADGKTISPLLESAFLRIYRADPTPGATALLPTKIEFVCDEAYEKGVDQTIHAYQVIFLANESTITLGWPTLEADLNYSPWLFDNAVLAQLKVDDPRDTQQFRFDPAGTGLASLRIAGDCFYVGAGDRFSNSTPPLPIAGMDIGGVLYIDHGGLLTIDPNKNFFVNTVIAQRLAATAAQTGLVAVPYDQITYCNFGALQFYDVDFSADAVNGQVHLPTGGKIMWINMKKPR